MSSHFDPTTVILADHPAEWKVPTEYELFVCGERDQYGNWTAAAKQMQNKLSMDRWFLVRNDHKIRVRGQRSASEYITRLGIEYPVFGLEGVYKLYNDVVKNSDHAKDVSLRAFRLGVIQPITIEKAQELYDRAVEKVGKAQSVTAIELLLGPRPGGWN